MSQALLLLSTKRQPEPQPLARLDLRQVGESVGQPTMPESSVVQWYQRTLTEWILDPTRLVSRWQRVAQFATTSNTTQLLAALVQDW